MIEFLQNAFVLVTVPSLIFTVVFGLMLGGLYVWAFTGSGQFSANRILYSNLTVTVAFFIYIFGLRVAENIVGWERVIGTTVEFVIFNQMILAGISLRVRWESRKRLRRFRATEH